MSNVQEMYKPNAERVEEIRRWHIDQAVGAAVPVSMFNITITFDGEINTKGLYLDPLQAQLMLPELRRVVQLIETQLPEEDAPVAMPVHSGNVVALRR